MKKTGIYLIGILFCIHQAFALRADINKDGRVDLFDLSILAEEWLMTELYGPELVTNGDFDGNADGWTLDGDWQYANGKISVFSANDTETASQTLSIQASGVYQIEFDVYNLFDGTLNVALGGIDSEQIINASGSYSLQITASQGSDLVFGVSNSGMSVQLDNVSVKQIYADPFSQVYSRLWECLENDSNLASLVQVGNRIRLDERNLKQEKRRHSDRDLPELRIEPAGGSCHLKRTNTTIPITQKFDVVCTTGDLRVDRSFFPVKFALLNALSSINEDINLSFVKEVQVSDITDARNTDKKDGWNAAFEIEVEMWFKTVTT